MTLRELEPGLESLACPTCHGDWLPGLAYQRWRQAHGVDLPERELTTEEVEGLPVHEDLHGKLCPECGCLLLPYHVGHGLAFSLNYCGRCGGTWFEANEWAQMRAANLHDNLHQVFTQMWQAGVARAERAREHERNLRVRFGDADFERAREVRTWLHGHPHRSAILAYLTAPEES
jgi:Zn-finger nucleic acid-binding protein